MDSSIYQTLQGFADTWGIVYMFAIFLMVVAMVLLPGARARAQRAAQIVLTDDDHTPGKEHSHE